MSTCWQCSADVEQQSLFCPHCDILQPPSPGRSFFDVLGLPEQFHVDLKQAEKRHKRLNLQLHPDRFVLAGPRVKRFSLEHSTGLNDAYRTLRDPAKRAIYMLGLWGKPVTESSGRRLQMSFEFLEKVMDLRERLVAAKHSAEGGEAVIQGTLEHVRTWQKQLTEQLEQAFSKQPSPGQKPDDETLAAIERLVHQQKYLTSILSDYGAAR